MNLVFAIGGSEIKDRKEIKMGKKSLKEVRINLANKLGYSLISDKYYICFYAQHSKEGVFKEGNGAESVKLNGYRDVDLFVCESEGGCAVYEGLTGHRIYKIFKDKQCAIQETFLFLERKDITAITFETEIRGILKESGYCSPRYRGMHKKLFKNNNSMSLI